jgi:hypothetical protein
MAVPAARGLPMVDREGRRTAALLVHQLRDGEITNVDFEVRWPQKTADRALRAIGFVIFFSTTGFTMQAITYDDEGRAAMDRCALFLDSGLEYEWPRDRIYAGGKAPRLAFVLTLGLYLFAYIYLRRRYLEQEAAGDSTVWPFIRRSDYEQERHRQRHV